MSALYLRIAELEGSAPITLTLSGGVMPDRGVAYETKQIGAKHIPIGSLRATQAVTGVEHADTEMKLYVEVPFVGPGDVQVVGARTPKTPEDLARLLTFLQERGRRTLVTLGAFAREGRLAGHRVELTRGYSIDFLGALAPPGANCEIALTWEWADAGERTSAAGTLPGADLAGGLGEISAKLPTLLSPDALVADLVDQIRDRMSSALEGIEKVKSLCRRVNSLVTAPARLANEIAAAAKSAAKSLSELDDLLSRTPEESAVVGTGAVAAVRAKRATGRLSAGVGEAMDAVVAVLDALAQRRAREVGVRPGESLALVAKRELGSADRWPAIASLNEIAGQVVPPATFVIEVPGS